MTNENTVVSTLKYDAMRAAVNEAVQRYLSTDPKDKAGNSLTSSADLNKAVKLLTVESVEGGTDSKGVYHQGAGDLLAKAGIDAGALCEAIAKRQGVKATMRMSEFFAALYSADYRKLDAVTVLTILANVRAGAVSRDAVSFACTGKGDDETSSVVKSVELVRKIQRACGKTVGTGTERSQVSRSFGKNGFCGDIGLGRFTRDEKTGVPALHVNGNNSFYKIVAKLIDNASEATLATMKVKKEKGAVAA